MGISISGIKNVSYFRHRLKVVIKILMLKRSEAFCFCKMLIVSLSFLEGYVLDKVGNKTMFMSKLWLWLPSNLLS